MNFWKSLEASDLKLEDGRLAYGILASYARDGKIGINRKDAAAWGQSLVAKYTDEKKGLQLRIMYDEHGDGPREWDNLGTMVCWHDRYTLGDEQPECSPEEWITDYPESNYFILPLFLYDHSGITISCAPFSCGWDSGQVGYIYVSKEAIRKEWKVQKIGPKLRKTIVDNLEGEVKTYDQFLTGEVFGYEVYKIHNCGECGKEDEEFVDSCWSFFGDNWKKNGIADHLGEYAYLLYCEEALV